MQRTIPSTTDPIDTSPPGAAVNADGMAAAPGIERRAFILSAAAISLSATACASTSGVARAAAPRSASGDGYMFLSPAEARFLEAATDTMIPAQGPGPSATQAGVSAFIDRSLAGAYGTADGTYQDGPFAMGTPQQGYQMPAEPAGLYRLGISDAQNWTKAAYGRPFEALTPDQAEEALGKMQSGDARFATIPAQVFVGTLWFDTLCGYFSDPIHGGNRGMEGWKMLGFPGANPDLRKFVGTRAPVAPKPLSLANVMKG